METRAGPVHRAVFLDRDGTIIDDIGYLRDHRQIRLLSGAIESLTRLSNEGFLLILVSNQSGIGRGLVTAEEAERVHNKLVSILSRHGVEIQAAYYCPHAPEDQCDCRKPSPRMILEAAQALEIDLPRSFMVGDKLSDIEAGRRAGCQTILLASTSWPTWLEPLPDTVADNWAGVADYILIR